MRGTTFLAGTGSPVLADTDGNGSPEIYAPLLPFRMLTLRLKPGVPLDAPLVLGGWSLEQGEAGVALGAHVVTVGGQVERQGGDYEFVGRDIAVIGSDGAAVLHEECREP